MPRTIAAANATRTMRKKLFLHIGQTKTGSTSLQRFLHVNRAALAHRDVFYPPADGAHHHRHLFAALQAARPQLAEAAPVWMRTVAAIEAHAAPAAVLSCELFWHLFVGRGALRLQALQWMASTLSAFEVHVVCYLRPQDAWVEAMYNQLVKSGQTQAATQGFAQYLQRPQTGALLDYARVLEPWARAFGPQALVLRAFERANLVAGDVVDDFMALLGCDDLDGLARLPEAQQRISWPVCELLATFNREKGADDRRDAFMQLVADSVAADPRARLLDAQGVAAMRARYAPGNAQLAREHCGRAELFELPAGDEQPVYRGLSSPELAALLVKVFSARQSPAAPARRRRDAQAR